jgi:hypothetical protein
MKRSLFESIRGPIRKVFLSPRMDESQAALTESQRTAVRTFFDAASRRLEGARCLRDCGQVRTSPVLYREVLSFFLLALLASKETTFDSTTIEASSVLTRLDLALERSGPWRTKEIDGVNRARGHLINRDPLEVDRMPLGELSRRLDELDAVAQALSEVIAPRSQRQRAAARTLRRWAAATLLTAALAGIAFWALSPRNIALHKPATGSSRAFDTTAAGAVDGHRYGQLGFHSEADESPWLSIDLGQTYAIQRIKAYGRADCCYDQSVPLAAELSDDGVSFHQIAERKDAFSQFEPWVIEPTSATARFVRLRTLRRSYLVLSEVEVYGKRAK